MSEQEATTRPKKLNLAGACYAWAFVVMAVGGALCYFAATAQTTAEYSDTLNIGLLQDQALMMQGGIGLACAGIVGFFMSALIATIESRT